MSGCAARREVTHHCVQLCMHFVPMRLRGCLCVCVCTAVSERASGSGLTFAHVWQQQFARDIVKVHLTLPLALDLELRSHAGHG